MGGPKPAFILNDNEKEIIRKHYDSSPGCIKKVNELLGGNYPAWFLHKQAKKLSCTRKHDARLWTAEEEEILENIYPSANRELIQSNLPDRRWGQIKRKIHRLKLTKRDSGLTKQDILDILGHKHRYLLDKWIQKGWLHTGLKRTERTFKSHGDMYHIEPKHFRNFLIKHYSQIDFTAVDKFLFVQYVSGNMG
jgi:hypothetical protein